MRPEFLLTPLVPWLAFLASCSSPSKPPSADESRRRPVNTVAAIELQACRNDLQNVRLRATELGRTSEASAVTQANIAMLQNALAGLRTEAAQPRPNRVISVHFAYGSSRFEISNEIAADLIKEAKSAPLILLRGRTDGHGDAPIESKISRARAAAVNDYLVAAGVRPSHIRSTFQPSGDHAADNQTATGRALNRRVEIEIYSVMPVALSAAAPTVAEAH